MTLHHPQKNCGAVEQSGVRVAAGSFNVLATGVQPGIRRECFQHVADMSQIHVARFSRWVYAPETPTAIRRVIGLEAALFGLVPSGLALAGIALTCAGVALTVWSRRWKSSISSS